MQHNTPELRACQEANSDNISIPQAVANQYPHDSSYDQLAAKVREEHVFERPSPKEVDEFKRDLKKRPRELTEREIEKYFPEDSAKAWFTKTNDFQTTSIPNPIVNLDPLLKQKGNGLTMSDLNTIIGEVGGNPIKTSISKVIEDCNQSTETPAKQKSITESKRLIEHFKEKLSTYPKYLSYEGSVVLCVILSIGDTAEVKIGGLPKVDQDIIMGLLPPNAAVKLSARDSILSVEFTDAKDFILTYAPVETTEIHTGHPKFDPIKLNFFNAVIHPEKTDASSNTNNVPVEQAGGKVTVGGSLVLDSERIKQLVGNIPQEKPKVEEEEPPRRQIVSGRNAYEIRADVLQMAIDWTLACDQWKQKKDDDVVLLAKKFYSFVEDRNRR